MIIPFPKRRPKVMEGVPYALYCKACLKVVGVTERKKGRVDVHLVEPCHHGERAWVVQLK